MLKGTVLALIAVLGVTPSAAAEPTYEDGLRAYVVGQTEQALAIWKNGAADGQTEAQFSLGLLYASGSGIQRNMEEALKWWEAAANAGDVRAQMNLATTLSSEQEFLDLEAAEYWYGKAAQNGSAAAQTKVGDIILLYRGDAESG